VPSNIQNGLPISKEESLKAKFGHAQKHQTKLSDVQVQLTISRLDKKGGVDFFFKKDQTPSQFNTITLNKIIFVRVKCSLCTCI